MHEMQERDATFVKLLKARHERDDHLLHATQIRKRSIPPERHTAEELDGLAQELEKLIRKLEIELYGKSQRQAADPA